MSQIYGSIRGSTTSSALAGYGKGAGAANMILFSGAENYAYMICDTTSNSSLDWDSESNTINTSAENCFTTLFKYINSNQNALGVTDAVNNVMCNLHPYAGYYVGANKYPGWYDESYYSLTPGTTQPVYTSLTKLPGFAQFLDALTTPGFNYYVDFPLICTEVGQYDVPFNSYAMDGLTKEYLPSDFRYPPAYFSNTNPLWNYTQNNYGTPFYNGNYIPPKITHSPSGYIPRNEEGINNIGIPRPVPPIIGFMMDMRLFNCSFCVWAVRPNAGGNGSYQVQYNGCSSNGLTSTVTNPTYTTWVTNSGWNATQPDATTGCWASYPQGQPPAGPTFVAGQAVTSTTKDNDPNSLPAMNLDPLGPYGTNADVNTTYELQLVRQSNQRIYEEDPALAVNYNCMGADFGYIYEHIYGKQNPFNFDTMS
jgi:hypothetical protein